ncbi:olfactory receptor 8I2-like [Macrotis lagotis]|uniref:olfactory receptor 8I2-like n=1 Tax=Macrotis lagotis TaxID=92651 RepID=UPI003D69C8E2
MVNTDEVKEKFYEELETFILIVPKEDKPSLDLRSTWLGKISPQCPLSLYQDLPVFLDYNNLAFIDISYSSAVTPKALEDLQMEHKDISFVGCFVQVFCFCAFVCSECSLLGSMAYDRYAAICNPLLYSVVMSPKVCIWLGVVPYVVGFNNALITICIISSLTFCTSTINHFFCDITALLALSCYDSFNTEMVIFLLAGFTFLSSLIIIVISYVAIISAILKIHSAEGQCKAFSTCASHLLGVTIFYESLIFTYLQPET